MTCHRLRLHRSAEGWGLHPSAFGWRRLLSSHWCCVRDCSLAHEQPKDVVICMCGSGPGQADFVYKMKREYIVQ